MYSADWKLNCSVVWVFAIVAVGVGEEMVAPEKSTFVPVIKYFEPCSTSEGYVNARLILLSALTVFGPSCVAATEVISFLSVTPVERLEDDKNAP